MVFADLPPERPRRLLAGVEITASPRELALAEELVEAQRAIITATGIPPGMLSGEALRAQNTAFADILVNGQGPGNALDALGRGIAEQMREEMLRPSQTRELLGAIGSVVQATPGQQQRVIPERQRRRPRANPSEVNAVIEEVEALKREEDEASRREEEKKREGREALIPRGRSIDLD